VNQVNQGRPLSDPAACFAVGVVGVEEGEPGLGRDVEAEEAAAFGPLVVLFGENRADQAENRGPVGEDPAVDYLVGGTCPGNRLRPPVAAVASVGTCAPWGRWVIGLDR